MQLSHSFIVPASAADTWVTFMDLEIVGGCFPGATVTEFDADDFKGTVKVKLGPIALVYAGSGTFVERDDSTHRAVIEAKGKDKRGNGTAGAKVAIQLTEESPSSTRAEVATDLAITGKPAQFGRGVMQDVSDKLLKQFIDCIEAKLSPAAAAPQKPEGGGLLTSEQAPVASDQPLVAIEQPPVASEQPPVGPAAPPPDSLDLGAAVFPVLLRSYGGHLAAGLAGLVAGILIGGRRRRG